MVLFQKLHRVNWKDVLTELSPCGVLNCGQVIVIGYF